MNFRRPEIWLITGIPAAGKTTVARALAARLERSAHIEGEQLWQQIVAGHETPSATTLEGEAERQYELVIRNQCLLARSYAEAGFTPILDFVVVTRSHLEAYMNYLAGGALRVVALTPSLDIVAQRDADRGSKTGSTWSPLDETLRTELSGAGLWLDTSTLTVEQTVDAILERAEEALVRRV